MERRDRAAIATFFADESFASGATIDLSEGAAQHVRVRRLGVGHAVRLTNGRGSVAHGKLARLTKKSAAVEVEQVDQLARPPELRLFVPVADRERMLWLAEKCTELAVTSWHPVHFRRSASVTSRGEGDAFGRKIRARMVAALEQSGGGWLPEVAPALRLGDALVRSAAPTDGERFLMDRDGPPLVSRHPSAADVMIGPEGGVEPDERTLIVERHGWVPASLGDTTLRFETAGMVAVGILRALLANS